MGKLGTFKLGEQQLGTADIEPPASNTTAQSPNAGASGVRGTTINVSQNSSRLGVSSMGSYQLGASQIVRSQALSITPASIRRQEVAALVTSLSATTPAPSLSAGSTSVSAPVTAVDGVSPAPAVLAGTRRIQAALSALSTDSPNAGVGYDDWLVENVPLPELISEVRTQKELEFRLRATEEQMREAVRKFDAAAGKSEVVVFADGSFETIDRSSVGNTYDLTAPVGRNTLRQDATYHVSKYQEQTIDQVGQRHEARITLLADNQREASGSEISESRSSGEWKFEFSKGAIATSSVRSETTSEEERAVDHESVVLHLTEEQAQVVEASATYLDAVKVREVPDGTNYMEDNSPNDRNVVQVTAPNDGDEILETGQYAVKAWETEWLSDARFAVRLTLAREGQVIGASVSNLSSETPNPTVS